MILEPSPVALFEVHHPMGNGKLGTVFSLGDSSSRISNELYSEKYLYGESVRGGQEYD